MQRHDGSMGEEARGADYFNRGHWLSAPQIWLSLRKRRELYETWKAHVPTFAEQRVLDYGTTPDLERADSNCFVRWLVQDGAEVSLTSVEDIAHLAGHFPSVTILPTLSRGPDGAAFLAQDIAPQDRFDWVCSSAVLEHVGSFDNQVAHIKECARLGRNIFLTTPAREHWLEFHTKLPFIHWLPRERHRGILRRLGYEDWSREEWLRLVSADELKQLADRALGSRYSISISNIRALGAPSNLLLLAREK